jgi:hypothetical protein
VSGGVLAGIIAGLVGLIVTGVLRSLLAKEVEGWIESLPGYLLRMARARVPSSHRDLLYDEWVAELHAALHGTEARPVTRLDE